MRLMTIITKLSGMRTDDDLCPNKEFVACGFGGHGTARTANKHFVFFLGFLLGTRLLTPHFIFFRTFFTLKCCSFHGHL